MNRFILGILISFNVIALDDFNLYKYGDTKIELERTKFIVYLDLHKTEDDLVKAYAKATDTPVDEVNIRAYTQTADGDDVCVINVVKPTIWDDRESLTIIGHELMHCGLADHQDVGKEAEKAVEDQTELDYRKKRDEYTLLLLEELKTDCKDYIENPGSNKEPVGCKELGFIPTE